ncbi:MAG TPA: VOC family protein [Candidatus Limnocylindria bacterium]|nr:VOC family protein [Candidatus Limnocylindria bacterium]
MASTLNPYISFDGNARQAMDYYHQVFGGELRSTTFAEGGMPSEPADAGKVMHAQLDTPAGFTLMASDTATGMSWQAPGGITISLSGDDEAELRGYWDRLVDGGSVTLPLEKAPWGDSFGMVTDRFGVPWMVNIAGSPAG